jgi:hypothetical protein
LCVFVHACVRAICVCVGGGGCKHESGDRNDKLARGG